MSATDYDALKAHIHKGQVRVIDHLLEHLWPHPVGKLRTGRVSLQAVAREVSKANRPKTAHVLLCVFDELLPRLSCNTDMVQLSFDAMEMLRAIADYKAIPRAAQDRFAEHIRGARELVLDAIDNLVWWALDDASLAILPRYKAAALIGRAFDLLCDALAASLPDEPPDLYDEEHLDLNKETERDFTRRIIGRIEAKFAFAQASSAVLE